MFLNSVPVYVLLIILGERQKHATLEKVQSDKKGRRRENLGYRGYMADSVYRKPKPEKNCNLDPALGLHNCNVFLPLHGIQKNLGSSPDQKWAFL